MGREKPPVEPVETSGPTPPTPSSVEPVEKPPDEPVETSGPPAAPLPRAGAIVAAAVVLGTTAHLAAAGDLRASGLLVTVMLLVLVVTGILAAGARVARALPSPRSARTAEDAAATLALLAGQVLVHWVGGGAPVAGGAVPGGRHHAGPSAGDAMLAGHSSPHSWGMLAAHCLAALMVGLLLRALEHNIVRLGLAVRSSATELAASIGIVVAALLAPVTHPARPRSSRVVTRRRGSTLILLAAAVVRRGPPVLG